MQTLDAMPLTFREDRATQAAAKLLRMHGGSMSYMKLLKLMYFADRQALLTLGGPITYDRAVSMDRGPVLSHTYDLIKGNPGVGEGGYWNAHISCAWWRASLTQDPPSDQLSNAEEAILVDVYRQYAHLGKYELSQLTHNLPEWRDPQGSSSPISLRDILRGEKMSDEDADALLADLHASQTL